MSNKNTVALEAFCFFIEALFFLAVIAGFVMLFFDAGRDGGICILLICGTSWLARYFSTRTEKKTDVKEDEESDESF